MLAAPRVVDKARLDAETDVALIRSQQSQQDIFDDEAKHERAWAEKLRAAIFTVGEDMVV